MFGYGNERGASTGWGRGSSRAGRGPPRASREQGLGQERAAQGKGGPHCVACGGHVARRHAEARVAALASRGVAPMKQNPFKLINLNRFK